MTWQWRSSCIPSRQLPSKLKSCPNKTIIAKLSNFTADLLLSAWLLSDIVGTLQNLTFKRYFWDGCPYGEPQDYYKIRWIFGHVKRDTSYLCNSLITLGNEKVKGNLLTLIKKGRDNDKITARSTIQITGISRVFGVPWIGETRTHAPP